MRKKKEAILIHSRVSHGFGDNDPQNDRARPSAKLSNLAFHLSSLSKLSTEACEIDSRIIKLRYKEEHSTSKAIADSTEKDLDHGSKP